MWVNNRAARVVPCNGCFHERVRRRGVDDEENRGSLSMSWISFCQVDVVTNRHLLRGGKFRGSVDEREAIDIQGDGAEGCHSEAPSFLLEIAYQLSDLSRFMMPSKWRSPFTSGHRFRNPWMEMVFGWRFPAANDRHLLWGIGSSHTTQGSRGCFTFDFLVLMSQNCQFPVAPSEPYEVPPSTNII